MLKKFYPKKYITSVYSFDFINLYEIGFRGIIFDIDNTLVEHNKKADKRSVNFIQNLKRIGFKVILFSNNNKERVSSFAKEVNVPYIFKASKPNTKNYYKACEMLSLSKRNVVFVGDQLFTDIYGANKAEIYSILTAPINKKEEIHIKFKRLLEKPILYSYKKYIY